VEEEVEEEEVEVESWDEEEVEEVGGVVDLQVVVVVVVGVVVVGSVVGDLAVAVVEEDGADNRNISVSRQGTASQAQFSLETIN